MLTKPLFFRIVFLALLPLSVLLSSLHIPNNNIIIYYNVLAFKPTNTNQQQANNNISATIKSNINSRPVANAGSSQIVNENTTVALVGAGIDPNPNNTLTYLWRQIEGPDVKLSNMSSTNPIFTSPIIPSDTKLKFSLVIEDNKGVSSKPANVTITVKHINHPPIANAGQNQTVNAGYAVALDGSASRDPDGDPLSYSWKQIAGAVAVKLNNANTPIATFTASSNISTDTTLGFRFR